MKEKFYTLITSIGKSKITKATAEGTKLNITSFAVGDGNGDYYNPSENQIALKREVWRGNISSIKQDKNNTSWLVVETILTAEVGDFIIREAGIFDEAGDLIAIGKYPESYKPRLSDGSAKDFRLRMILEISNAASLILKIDPSVTLVTKSDLEEFDERITIAQDKANESNNKVEELKEKNKELDAKVNEFELSLKKINKVKPNIIVMNVNWTQNSTTKLWEYKIVDLDITEDTMVDINIQIDYLEKAESIKSVTQSFKGYVMLYATDMPLENIIVDMRLSK